VDVGPVAMHRHVSGHALASQTVCRPLPSVQGRAKPGRGWAPPGV